MKKKDKIRKIIVYSLAVIFLLEAFRFMPIWQSLMDVIGEGDSTHFFFGRYETGRLQKKKMKTGLSTRKKEENQQSQDSERLLYYLALGEFLMFLGTLLSGLDRLKFSKVSGARMVYDPLYAGYGRSKKASFLL